MILTISLHFISYGESKCFTNGIVQLWDVKQRTLKIGSNVMILDEIDCKKAKIFFKKLILIFDRCCDN